MDAEIALLRILHILPGVIWVGSAIFVAWVVQPALKKTGPPHAGALMSNMLKPLMITIHGSAAATIFFGIVMAFRVPGSDQLWSTNWGTMIWLGFVLSVIGWGAGAFAGLTNKKMVRIGASLQGQPSPEQGTEIARLRDRAILFAKVGSLFVLAAVVCMALVNHI
jgi:putative copper export protein|tara:strand:- start:506 stop:1000 length:495 start_codon:yes stop_codon:yes gene_type:complete